MDVEISVSISWLFVKPEIMFHGQRGLQNWNTRGIPGPVLIYCCHIVPTPKPNITGKLIAPTH